MSARSWATPSPLPVGAASVSPRACWRASASPEATGTFRASAHPMARGRSGRNGGRNVSKTSRGIRRIGVRLGRRDGAGREVERRTDRAYRLYGRPDRHQGGKTRTAEVEEQRGARL